VGIALGAALALFGLRRGILETIAASAALGVVLGLVQ
jgi:hypothetical protein